nr:fanconi-associated nuclease 1 like [Quercus suber]
MYLKIDPESGASEEVRGECSVESFCLSHYRTLGYKGYHTESSILRTLFAYLFFDILFLYIPNVFQTAFQTCPLDLFTDSFYASRMSEIHLRLNEISNGQAPGLIQKVWDEHNERKTCVVGLRWDFEIQDLLEIAQCFPPAALSTVMKVLVQEYGQRGGGVPDLFLWKAPVGEHNHFEDGAKQAHNDHERHGKGEVMFAEVKSENDRLSDTQRMWIDVLSNAGVKVELCHAVASEVKTQ